MAQLKKSAIVFAVLLAVFVGFFFAQAQQAPPPRGGQSGRDPMMERRINQMFRDMDVNHTGKITKKEWMDHWTTYSHDLFNRIDINHNGYITKDDVRADMEAMRAQQQQQQMRGRGAPPPPE